MRTAASLRSSFFADRPRAALWTAAVLGAIGLIVAVLIGFNSHSTHKTVRTRRVVVAAYIVRVGRIQAHMASQVRAVDQSYKLFAKSPQHARSRAREYSKAERTLALLRRRLAAVRPPVEARRLHALLLDLAGRNVAVAAAVAALASYLPSLAQAQAPLRGAVLELRNGVRSAKSGARQADAFAAYAGVTRTIADRVAGLRAPSFFAAARDAEATQLRRLSALAAEVGDALRHKHAGQAQALLGELAHVQAQTTVARAQRAAALAYNAKLAEIARTAKLIDAERRRLERQVPNS